MTFNDPPITIVTAGNILLVDDDQVDQMMAVRTLKRANLANNIVWFKCARDALNCLLADKDGIFDAILLDVNMPRMNGLEFLQSLSLSDPHLRRTPVLVMVSSPLSVADHARFEGFENVKAFVPKPLDKIGLSVIATTLEAGTCSGTAADLRRN